jgi:hypothetical protein
MTPYKINTYANGFGIWHTEIFFTPPIGNTGEAERVAANAIKNAKRKIRQAITERAARDATIKRLSYEVADYQALGTNHLARLTIREK